MSKLDIIILDCVNKALDGNQEKLGDYIDPTKTELKALMLELLDDMGSCDGFKTSETHGSICKWCGERDYSDIHDRAKLITKIEAL